MPSIESKPQRPAPSRDAGRRRDRWRRGRTRPPRGGRFGRSNAGPRRPASRAPAPRSGECPPVMIVPSATSPASLSDAARSRRRAPAVAPPAASRGPRRQPHVATLRADPLTAQQRAQRRRGTPAAASSATRPAPRPGPSSPARRGRRRAGTRPGNIRSQGGGLHRRQGDVAQRHRKQPDPDPQPLRAGRARRRRWRSRSRGSSPPTATARRARRRRRPAATARSRSGGRWGRKTTPSVVIHPSSPTDLTVFGSWRTERPAKATTTASPASPGRRRWR